MSSTMTRSVRSPRRRSRSEPNRSRPSTAPGATSSPRRSGRTGVGRALRTGADDAAVAALWTRRSPPPEPLGAGFGAVMGFVMGQAKGRLKGRWCRRRCRPESRDGSPHAVPSGLPWRSRSPAVRLRPTKSVTVLPSMSSVSAGGSWRSRTDPRRSSGLTPPRRRRSSAPAGAPRGGREPHHVGDPSDMAPSAGRQVDRDRWCSERGERPPPGDCCATCAVRQRSRPPSSIGDPEMRPRAGPSSLPAPSSRSRWGPSPRAVSGGREADGRRPCITLAMYVAPDRSRDRRPKTSPPKYSSTGSPRPRPHPDRGGDLLRVPAEPHVRVLVCGPGLARDRPAAHPANALAAVPVPTTPTIIAVITAATARLRTRSQSGSWVYRSWSSRLIDATVYGSQCTPPFAIVW